MTYRLLNLLTLLFFFFSCKNTETFEDKLDNEIILAFNNLDNISKTRIINIIKAEQYGITKQAEGIIQKGKKLGC